MRCMSEERDALKNHLDTMAELQRQALEAHAKGDAEEFKRLNDAIREANDQGPGLVKNLMRAEPELRPGGYDPDED